MVEAVFPLAIVAEPSFPWVAAGALRLYSVVFLSRSNATRVFGPAKKSSRGVFFVLSLCFITPEVISKRKISPPSTPTAASLPVPLESTARLLILPVVGPHKTLKDGVEIGLRGFLSALTTEMEREETEK